MKSLFSVVNGPILLQALVSVFKIRLYTCTFCIHTWQCSIALGYHHCCSIVAARELRMLMKFIIDCAKVLKYVCRISRSSVKLEHPSWVLPNCARNFTY